MKQMVWKSTSGKTPRKLAPATGSVKKPHRFCLGMVALRERSRSEPDFLHQIVTQSQDINLVATLTPLLSPVLGKRFMSLSGIGNASDDVMTLQRLRMISDDDMQAREKRRQLNMEQVRTLERNFEL
ncbi:hypothetical protein ZIOFF_044870 [Zingiber officinale]|uniref:Uncharacterized protein n=1 Tax=Zingiber officinale TaxID=94328 RepID=A0A8J5FZB8_ZINOF|nr:hypothetical protein ZIOFF_044870 [Zingiber officinale]